MCGIFGDVGADNAVAVTLNGLKFLEYRGYDSSGIATYNGHEILVRKKEGRVALLEESLTKSPLAGNVAIGHTRWATHGVPSDNNAHPFTSNGNKFAVVHNGIIENYRILKEFLMKKGFVFLSDTDSEVIANLIEYYYVSDSESAILAAVKDLKGSYALGIISACEPDKIFAVKKDNPLIIGLSALGNCLCSDVIGLKPLCQSAYALENCNIAIISERGLSVKNYCGEKIEPTAINLDDVETLLPGKYDCFMKKEISEIPAALARAVENFSSYPLPVEKLKNAKRIVFIGCGTALHSTFIAKYYFRRLIPDIDVYCASASEFCYEDYPIKKTVFIAVSQSGETADTILAVKKIKEKKGAVIAVCNVASSALAKEADYFINISAGAEIAVASTKAYNCQTLCLCALTTTVAHIKGVIDDNEFSALINELSALPELSRKALLTEQEIANFAKNNYLVKSVFFIGRGMDYYLSCESSLKLKEISYVHSEAYAGGELKHGTLALIEEGVLVVAIVTQEDTLDKMISNVSEVKCRGAKVLTITSFDSAELEILSDYVVKIPSVNPFFSPIISVIPSQFLAYYVALCKGCDIDKPRNLAKSVTVE